MASPSASVLFVKSTTTSTASRANVRDDRETPLLVARDGATSAADFTSRSTADACDRLARRANHLSALAACQADFVIPGRCEASNSESISPGNIAVQWIPGLRLPRKIASLFCRDGASRNDDICSTIGASSQQLRPAQAADHRHLQQIVAGQSGVGGGAPEKIAEFIVGRLQVAFVLD
jgi:hypothetical protein